MTTLAARAQLAGILLASFGPTGLLIWALFTSSPAGPVTAAAVVGAVAALALALAVATVVARLVAAGAALLAVARSRTARRASCTTR